MCVTDEQLSENRRVHFILVRTPRGNNFYFQFARHVPTIFIPSSHATVMERRNARLAIALCWGHRVRTATWRKTRIICSWLAHNV